jgi:hypothetical protein
VFLPSTLIFARVSHQEIELRGSATYPRAALSLEFSFRARHLVRLVMKAVFEVAVGRDERFRSGVLVYFV